MPAAYSATARRAPFWRAFSASDCTEIDRHLAEGRAPCCPGCATTLEARAGSRMARWLPEGVRAFDLECRWCRRFRCVARREGAGPRLQGMRRLLAAVQSAQPAEVRTGRRGKRRAALA
jgi:hypothetical protein